MNARFAFHAQYRAIRTESFLRSRARERIFASSNEQMLKLC